MNIKKIKTTVWNSKDIYRKKGYKIIIFTHEKQPISLFEVEKIEEFIKKLRV